MLLFVFLIFYKKYQNQIELKRFDVSDSNTPK